ncbi:tetrathionate respiration histidine kinase TtrS [Klebsiella grimontii]|uniref:tetrathionate respiration histidine kinase TtrS n=1 Tax=Klebsiella grimontii TaxID=2058152 RepID=UPI002246411C|nr:tetrathionate respiration histidine kinase TtrS [Klebsiella grimontii]MCW9526230.1 tetrathionate respiration histidine kinase TtrS [Klebsiella grimontii]
MGAKTMGRLALLISTLLLICPARADSWYIGLLSIRGDAIARSSWQPLESFLNQQMPDQQFHIRPLDLHEMQEAVKNGSVQFVVTHPGQFVQLNTHFPLRWLASLRASHGVKNIIGSVILARRDGEIKTPMDLIGKTVGAIDPLAFGGYLLGYKALSDAGLRPDSDLHLRFTGFPADALIYLLRENAVQAAIVPACLLEMMDEEGLIDKVDFVALITRPESAPCVTSTRLYRDWSFAALPTVSDEVADRVTRVLLNAPDNAVFRWGAPASTSQAEALMRELKQHPQQRLLWMDVRNWFVQNRLLVAGAGLILILLILNYIWVMLLVRRRGRQLERSAIRLREQEQALETARQISVLGEMTSGFAHELNQPLSAIRHYAQGCSIRLQKQDPQHPLLSALENIDLQAQRGAETLRNLRLWVSQAQGESVTAEKWESVRIVQAIDNVWQWLHVPRQFPGLRKISSIDHALTIVLPPVLLEQVLANLILNAAQAGAKMLWIDAVRDAGSVRIVLQDNGGGIDDAQLAQAFQPFKSSRQEGMGLGLVICQRLVRYGRGEIGIRNQTAPDGRPGAVVVLAFTHQEERSDNGDNSSLR